MDKNMVEQRNRWIDSAKKEAEKISTDIDFVIEQVKQKVYTLEMARDEFLWRVLDLENFYVNSDLEDINKIYQEVLNKAKEALKKVEEKIQEEGLSQQ